jgi:tryptophanyl-tRNA synthetase
MCSTAGWGCIDCKRVLLDGMTRELSPIHERARELRAHPERVREVLAAGAERCRALARETMAYVKEKMGLV